MRAPIVRRKVQTGFSIPELVVLSLLDQRDMFGLELARAVSTLTSGGQSHIGIIYSVLKDLNSAGYVERSRTEGKSRNFYSLTPPGHDRLRSIAVHWDAANKAISELVAQASERTPDRTPGAHP